VTGAGIVVEAGGPADLPAVMTVMEDSFDPSFGEAWTGSQCAGLLPMTGVWLTVARDGGEPIGFALSRIAAGEAELLLLAVRNGAQRRGAGKMLLDRFISDAQSRGAEKLHLEVRDGNHAIALYKRVGFREIGRRINYYRGASGQQYDALTLGRTAKN
jgi:ribosomal-protein-alanine N-acetyltransferase